MEVLLCLAALLSLGLGSDVTYPPSVSVPLPPPSHFRPGPYLQQHIFGFPGSDPRCHDDGDLVMDPVNRCQVYRCVMQEKKHGYDDQHVYKYFDVEAVSCPTVKVPAYIPHAQYAHVGKEAAHAHGHQGYGYGYKVHEVDIQTSVNKLHHAQYLDTHVRGDVAALCGDYAYQPGTDCADVKSY